jgi:hypothetical protein
MWAGAFAMLGAREFKRAVAQNCSAAMSRSIYYERGLRAGIGRVFNIVAHWLYLDLEPAYLRSVFICGAPRSGTTWLAEVLNHANDYRYIYEPFNREHVSLCRHFSERQYVRPHDDRPQFLEPARAIFAGRIRNGWVDQHNRKAIASRRLIKDVRSTLMLKWICEHFPGMPIVFMLRHPCAVANSRVKVGYANDLNDVLLRQPSLMEDHLAPFADQMSREQSAFEHQITDWCVENYVPLATLGKGDVYLAFYERLCVDPESELRKLFAFLKMPFDESSRRRIARPSSTSRRRGERSAMLAGESLIDGWRKHVSAAEQKASEHITRVFGLDRIYGESSLPDAQFAESLIGGAPVPIH